MQEKELTIDQKLEYIYTQIKDTAITAYEVAKGTGLNESGLNRIFKKEIKRPHKSTVNILYDFIEAKKNKLRTNDIDDVLTEEEVKIVSDVLLLKEEQIMKKDFFKKWLKEKQLEAKIEALEKYEKDLLHKKQKD